MLKIKQNNHLQKYFFIIAICFIIIFLPSISAFNWNDEIISYYKLDETSGSIAYDSLGVNNANIVGGVTLGGAGIINNSYSFDGVDDGANVGDLDIFIKTSYTINAWVKADGVGSGVIFGEGTDVSSPYNRPLYKITQSDSKIQVYLSELSGDRISTTGTITCFDDTWHMITFIVNDTNYAFYVDNVLDFSGTMTKPTSNAYSTVIGAVTDGSSSLSSFFDGKIDEVGIWDRAITTGSGSELEELYNNGVGLSYDDLIPFINLNLPHDDSSISDVGANFTATFNISESNPNNYVWKNATYYVWKNDELFNTTNVTLSGNNTEYTQFIDSFTLADYEWDVLGWYGNSTYNNYTWASNGNFSFSVGATIDSEQYDNITYETAENSFGVNVTLLSGVVLQAAYLYYDDVRYVGTVTSLGDNKYAMTKTLNTPLLSNGTVNKTFYWSFVYTSPVQKTQNTTAINQTISPIFFGKCNATYTVHALDMLLKEEGTFDLLNGTLEFAADYWLGTGDVRKELTFSYLGNDTNNYDFCIFPSDRTFYIDDIISYTADGYDRRDYFLSNASLSNSTMNLSLYLALATYTDIFTFTVQDQDSKPVEGAFINIQRWDIGTNNFYTVGMVKTTSDGTGIINMRLNDAWYRYQVIYNGALYLTTEPVKEASTSRILEINLAEDNPYNQFKEIDYSLTYDEDTNVSVFTYSDSTGAVSIGCLKVLKMEGNGTNEVYYSCVSSSSGTLSYHIDNDGTYIIRAIFKLSSAYDNIEQVVDEIIRQGTPERFIIIGKFGQFISLMMVGTGAMLGISIGSIPLGLGLISASLVLVNLLGWLNITSSVLYGLISIIILIALNLRRGR